MAAIGAKADILIVGAGAAGCALACLLARAGRDVLVVERCRASGKDKPCGGVVTGAGQRLMGEIYGEEALDALGAARIDSMRVFYRNHETALPMDFRALPRARLDAFLLKQAAFAGTRFMERTAVAGIDEAAHVATCKDLSSDETLQVEYGTLVAADGANSTVRNLFAERRPRTAVSLVAETAPPADDSAIVQRVYPGVAGGCWLIPQGDAAVVGCLFFPEASHEPVGDMRGRVHGFAAELGVPCGRLRGAPAPAGDDVMLRSSGGTYFIGDAAGLAEPALGAGIHLALQSAAALAGALLGGGEPYENAMASVAARLREGAEDVAAASLRLGFAALMRSGSQRANASKCKNLSKRPEIMVRNP